MSFKLEIHRHDNNAEYKSSQTNLVFSKEYNKMVHQSIDDMSDSDFNDQVDNGKLIRVYHQDTKDHRDRLKVLMNNLSARDISWSDDVQSSPCSNGSILTIIRKMARVMHDDSGSVGRFAPTR
tara:strand:- start:145 stop:513 length:369 start_codon:yes stop_codon:yes gene_type:complete